MATALTKYDRAEDLLRNCEIDETEFPRLDEDKYAMLITNQLTKPAAQLALINEIGEAATDYTDSYVYGLVGVDLAYLYQNIARPAVVGKPLFTYLPAQSLTARLLGVCFPDPAHAVWAYVVFED
jgi:hypothetical protein